MEIEVRKPDCYWTYEKCAEIALICIRRNELRKNFNGAYDAALRNNWLDKICEHMEKPYESNKRWTFDKCQELALNCKNKIEFKIKYTNASHAAQRNGWMNKICMHMEEGKKPNGYWTKDKCQEKALTCKTRHEFEKKYGSAYISSIQNIWIDDICVHMKPQ